MTWAEAHDVHTVLTAAMLVLMGLILAFTFSLSASRFDTRRALIVTEAVAIQSLHSDLDFLAPQPRAQALELLHAYLEQRIDFLTVGHDPAQERQTIAQARALHGALWRIATARAITRDPIRSCAPPNMRSSRATCS